MRHCIENSFLRVEIESHGAELKSVKANETGFEYMWYGDPKYWSRTSPVLFPFVGELKDKKYTFEDTVYEMGSHGFARDSEFGLVSKTENEIWFNLKDSEETYKNYPFHFELMVGYVLKDNSLDVKWIVKNPGQDREDGNLYFSIGAHPAFNCPTNGEENKAGYKLFFGEADKLVHHGNLTGTCTHEEKILELENHRAVITPDFFDRTTYIIEDKQLDVIGIETPDDRRYVTVNFDTPLVAVWSPTNGKNAPFICIEPWWGRADYDDFNGDLTSREYGNILAEGKEFSNTYTITFS